jgi:TonB-linked SusC/RagA family outer membrane protein
MYKIMKTKLLSRVIVVSQTLFLGFVLQSIFCCTLVASDLEAKSALAAIGKQTAFSFALNDKLIDLSGELSEMPGNNISLADGLKEISRTTSLEFRRINHAIPTSNFDLAAAAELKETIALQGRPVTGKVTSAEETEGVPGVSVIIKGTSQGTVTDANGEYKIDVPSRETILVFSSIGYVGQEIAVGAETVINVVMVADITALEEVVVVGYGTRKAGEVTGAVSTVTSENIQSMQITQASEALRGVAGVTVMESNTPGEGATIRIRGLGTINNNNPLWVVDGVPGGTVNPNNIESIAILKDAAAQAIYGARAANGVVLVTTKSGRKNQKPQVDVNVKTGITRNSNYYRLLNTQEYGEMLWLEAKNDGKTNFGHSIYGSGSAPDVPEYILPNRATNVDESLYDFKLSREDGDDTYLIARTSPGTDWLKEADRDAKFRDISFDLSGGGQNTIYSLQANYLNEEGILKWTGYERYSIQSNVTSDLTDWFQVGERLNVTYSEDYGHQGNNSESSVISFAYRMPPMIPVYDIAGNYSGTRGVMGNGRNPIFLLDKNQYDRRKALNTTANVYARIEPLDGLSFKTLFGVNYRSFHSKDIDYVERAHAERGLYDALTEVSNFSLQWNWTNTIEYTKAFNDLHLLTVMVGTEAIDNRFNQMIAGRTDYTLSDPSYIQLGTGIQSQSNNGSLSEWSLFSEFGRVNYSYADRYLFEGVVRRDGSSRFKGDNLYGVFPAFSVGWRISNEPFMASFKTWLSELKIRGGWGTTGNDAVGNYNSYTQFGIHLFNSFYGIDGVNGAQGSTGFYQSTFGNPAVRWETTQTTNFGVDAVLRNKLAVSLDIWQRRTTDMLYPQSVPMVYGQASVPSANVGEMLNRGFDIAIGYSGSALGGELKYNIDFNISHYKNEIVRLSGVEGEFLQGSAFREQFYSRAEKGTPFPAFYGYTVEGIFQTQQEADAWPNAFGAAGTYNKPGHYKFKDISGPEGVADNVINEYDRSYIGSPHPDLTTGLNFSATYKGFNLVAILYGSYGNDVINYARRFMDFVQFAGGRSYDRLYNSWGSPYLKDNTKAKLPMAESNDTPSQVASTAFLEDGSYLRLKNLRFGYDLNRILRLDTRSIQVYGQVSNIFTITKYSGLDPEVNNTSNSGRNMGIDAGAWPTPRQFLVGFNVGI